MAPANPAQPLKRTVRPDVSTPPEPLISKKYLLEIQGLRTFAALLVAIYHIWFNKVSGGVDAFFVIAAFFMVASFGRAEHVGFQSVANYWLSTARRIIPSASVVITATIIGSWLFLPRTLISETIRHAVASTLFVENWWLAYTGTDYLSKDAAPSAYQQFWALSLQVQFYLIFPLLIFLSIKISQMSGLKFKIVLNAIFVIILVVSFIYSVVLTSVNQPWAYFDSGARAWEYMIGGLVALNLTRMPSVNKTVMSVLGYVALLTLVTFAAIIPVSSLFPGYAALIPVVATAIIIWVSQNDIKIHPLRIWPVLTFANHSFSFYLWHWPLLIFYRSYFDTSEVSLFGGLSIIVIASALAWLGTTYLEAPFRRWKWLITRPFFTVACCALLILPSVLSTGAIWTLLRSQKDQAYQDLQRFNQIGILPRSGAIVPAAIIAREDLPELYANGCHQKAATSSVTECSFGDKSFPNTVALVGGSHSTQFFPLLKNIARKEKLRIVTFLKSDCVYTTKPVDFKLVDPKTCLPWNEEVEKRLLELSPAVVVTIATRGYGDHEVIPVSFTRRWETLTAAGIPVLALRDNPRFLEDPVTCAEQHKNDISSCSADRGVMYNSVDPGRGLKLSGVTYVDLAPVYCTEDMCPVERNGILMFRDRHHLTTTFVNTLEDKIKPALLDTIDLKNSLR